MDVQLLTLKIVQTLRQDGLLAALRKCLNNIKNERSADDFDLRYGTDTGGIEPLWKFKIHSPNAHFGSRYEVTQEQELADAVTFLREDLQGVVANMKAGCSKRLYIIYKGSQCTEIFDSCSFLTRFGNPPTAPHIQVWSVVG